MISIEEFRQAVQEMRDFQKSYFQNRMPATLNRAKAAEAKVDKMLVALRPGQLNLEPRKE